MLLVTLRQARLAGTTTLIHFKKLFVHGDNFLHERGGQRFWCRVASWRKSVVQHFDGVLWVFLIYAPNHNRFVSEVAGFYV